MTVNTTTSTATYTGNGVTVTFPVPFYFLANTDLQVLQKVSATGVTNTLALGTDYTLTGAGVEAGGSLTMTTAPASGDTLYIARDVAAVQETAYPSNSPFPASSHEMALDRLTMLAQQIQTGLGLTLQKQPFGSTYDLQGNTLINSAVAVNGADVPNLSQVQALTAAGSQAVLNTPSGASLVGFLQSGTGAVARTVQDKLSDALHVKDFGAKGDGVTDDTAALQNAINQAFASERPLQFHAGVFITSNTLTIPGPCQILGAGRGEFAYGSLPATSITRIKYTGPPNRSVMAIPASNMGGKLSGFHLDSNGTAQIGLSVGSVLGWDFSDIYISGYTVYGLQLLPLAAYVANCMMNTFKRVHVYSTANSTIGVYITGAGAVCNSCHNTFELLTVDYGGTNSEGIRIGNADNCVFTQTYIFSSGSTGSGVRLYGGDAAGFPVSISFYHLQSGPKGFVQDAGVNDNFIFGYAQDNGQPDPVSSGRLFYVSTNGGISPTRSLGGMGTTPGSNLAGIQAVATSATTATVTFSYPAEPNTSYAVQLTTTWQTTIAITSKSTTGFTVSFGTAAPAASSVHWLIVRTG